MSSFVERTYGPRTGAGVAPAPANPPPPKKRPPLKYRNEYAIFAAVAGVLILVSYNLGSYIGGSDVARLTKENAEQKEQLQRINTVVDGKQNTTTVLVKSMTQLKEDNAKLAGERDKLQKTVDRLNGERGALRTASIPPGATVRLGGEAVGKTPFSFQSVLAGKYDLEFSLEGYDPITIPVEVVSGKIVDVPAVQLTRSNGSISINSDPRGAAFTLTTTGVPAIRGTTPYSSESIPAGPYQLVLKQKGFPDLQQTVTVPRNDKASFDWTFGEGSIEISCAPAGGALSIDGKMVGAAPQSVTLPSGTHEIGIYYQQLLAKKESVNVIAGQNTPVKFDLPLAIVSVVTKPENADVWIGDSYCGKAPVTVSLPAGKYDIWAFARDYNADKKSTEMDNGEIRQMQIELGKAPEKQKASAGREDEFLDIYVEIELGRRLAESGQLRLAYMVYHEAAHRLKLFQARFKDYEEAVVSNRIKSVDQNLAALQEMGKPPVAK